jgi:hypothetical protein
MTKEEFQSLIRGKNYLRLYAIKKMDTCALGFEIWLVDTNNGDESQVIELKEFEPADIFEENSIQKWWDATSKEYQDWYNEVLKEKSNG